MLLHIKIYLASIVHPMAPWQPIESTGKSEPRFWFPVPLHFGYYALDFIMSEGGKSPFVINC